MTPYHCGEDSTIHSRITTPIRFILHCKAPCLKSQFYGRVKDLCSGVTDDQLAGENALSLIEGAIYYRDALSVVSEDCEGFNKLLNTRKGPSESMKYY